MSAKKLALIGAMLALVSCETFAADLNVTMGVSTHDRMILSMTFPLRNIGRHLYLGGVGLGIRTKAGKTSSWDGLDGEWAGLDLMVPAISYRPFSLFVIQAGLRQGLTGTNKRGSIYASIGLYAY